MNTKWGRTTNDLKALGIILSVLLMVGCAKEQEYEELFKPEVQSLKTLPQGELIYVPSVVGAPKKDDRTRPFWLGQTVETKVKITEHSIDLVEIEKDKKYQNNEKNEKLVLSIPIELFAYKCAEDDNGECTNKEEVDEEMPWQKRPFFKPDAARVKNIQKNFLPIELDNFFAGCHSEIEARLVDFSATPEAINIQIDRTFQTSGQCLNISSLEELKNATFTVRYHYSAVKKSILASTDYEKVLYPDADELDFGFFKDIEEKIQSDHGNPLGNQKAYLNRWNPKKDKITYLLSPEFKWEKYSAVREATIKSIARMNKILKKEGVKLQIELKDAKPDQKAGDIRHSMIVLVDNPTDSGLLGYGPSITNPQTGEILSARVVMYTGNITRFIKYAYDELIDEMKAQNAAKIGGVDQDVHQKMISFSAQIQQDLESLAKAEEYKASAEYQNAIRPALKLIKNESSLLEIPPQKNNSHQLHALEERSELTKMINKMQQDQLESHEIENHFLPFTKKLSQSGHTHLSQEELEKEMIEMVHGKGSLLTHSAFGKQLDFYSRNNAFHSSLYNFKELVSNTMNVENLPIDPKDPKNWDELADEVKQQIIDILLPHAFTSTFIHEVGHTIGLRHNFNGSNDRDQWHDHDELAAQGIFTDRTIPYSSMMDYGKRAINELPVIGKYDVAALRFAYNGEVEVMMEEVLSESQSQTGKKPRKFKKTKDVFPLGAGQERLTLASFKSLLGMLPAKEIEVESEPGKMEKLKAKMIMNPYEFCTDEHVSSSPGCNRFDEGTNFTEIVSTLIDDYHKNYEKRNLRGRRKEFSLQHDFSYALHIYGKFREIRGFFEQFHDFVAQLAEEGKYIPKELFETNPFLKDFRQAAVLSGKFFIDILKTPERFCLLQLIDQNTGKPDPDKILEVPLWGGIDEDNRMTSCHTIRWSPTVKYLGQGGKFMSHSKGSQHSNMVDQIDVRGHLIDKYLAVEVLTAVGLSSPIKDRYVGNYMKLDEVKTELNDLITKMATNDATVQTMIERKDGSFFTHEVKLDLMKTHKVKYNHFNSIMNLILGVFENEVDFVKPLIRTLGLNIRTENNEVEIYDQMLNTIGVFHHKEDAYELAEATGAEEVTVIPFRRDVMYALPQNKVALKLLSNASMAELRDEIWAHGVELAKTHNQENPQNQQEPRDALKQEAQFRAEVIIAKKVLDKTGHAMLEAELARLETVKVHKKTIHNLLSSASQEVMVELVQHFNNEESCACLVKFDKCLEAAKAKRTEVTSLEKLPTLILQVAADIETCKKADPCTKKIKLDQLINEKLPEQEQTEGIKTMYDKQKNICLNPNMILSKEAQEIVKIITKADLLAFLNGSLTNNPMGSIGEAEVAYIILKKYLAGEIIEEKNYPVSLEDVNEFLSGTKFENIKNKKDYERTYQYLIAL